MTAAPPRPRIVWPTTRPGRRARWGFAGLLLVLVAGVWACWSTTIDDAYITYRYSANWAAGFGPVWNPGQDPVEGFTNFAWMAWHVPFAWAGVPLPAVSKLTAAGCGAAVVWLLWREPATLAGRLTACAALLLFLPTYVHVDAGLETMAFATVLLRAVVLGARVLHGRVVRCWELPAALLLAGTLRPEGVVAVLPPVAVWLWSRPGRRGYAATVVAVTAGLAYFGWRWSFYGQLLPNTFYVKFGHLDAGEHWLQVTVAALLPLLALAAALALRDRAGLLILATVAACCAVYAVSGPSMDYVHRFAFHVVPVLCLAAALALDGVPSRRLAAAAGLLAVAWTTTAGVTASDARTLVNYGVDLERAHVAIGRGLAAADVPRQARTLAITDAGAVPYYSGWRTTDLLGLNDEAIARGAPPGRVLEQANPTVRVVTGPTPTMPAPVGYQPVADAQMRDGYWQHVYARPEWSAQVAGPVNAELARAAAASDGRTDTGFRRWLARIT